MLRVYKFTMILKTFQGDIQFYFYYSRVKKIFMASGNKFIIIIDKDILVIQITPVVVLTYVLTNRRQATTTSKEEKKKNIPRNKYYY